MLSIGVTVCDTDYHLLDSLLKQIDERVQIPHEVIIIDNREEFLNVLVKWKSGFTFGYNATQFSARSKIIELANGDYIWFIDGDDEIDYVDSFDYTEDIITFSYSTYKIGDVHIDSQIITDDIFTFQTGCLIHPVLWNKFIKKDLFKTKFPETKIIANEDTLWLYSAMKNARSLRIVDKVIYHHKLGLSNKEIGVTFENVKTLVTGYDEMRKLLKDLVNEDFYRLSIEATNAHVMSFIPRCNEVEKATEYFLDLIPKDEFRTSLIKTVFPKSRTQSAYKKIFDTVSKRYGEQYCYPTVTCKVTYDDGRVEDYTFIQTIEFENN